MFYSEDRAAYKEIILVYWINPKNTKCLILSVTYGTHDLCTQHLKRLRPEHLYELASILGKINWKNLSL